MNTYSLKEIKVKGLGNLLQSLPNYTRAENAITIADLTGVAVRDVQIATAVCDAFEQG